MDEATTTTPSLGSSLDLESGNDGEEEEDCCDGGGIDGDESAAPLLPMTKTRKKWAWDCASIATRYSDDAQERAYEDLCYVTFSSSPKVRECH